MAEGESAPAFTADKAVAAGTSSTADEAVAEGVCTSTADEAVVEGVFTSTAGP